MTDQLIDVISGVIVDEDSPLSLAELCRCCSLPAEALITMIEHGLVDPLDTSAVATHWQFSRNSVLRIQTAIRLQRDLNVNLEGAALALELLDEIKSLRQTVANLMQK